MNPAIHSVIRVSFMALAILSIPVSAIFCRTISRMAAGVYDEVLGGKPLLELTSVVVIGQAESLGGIHGGIALAILLAVVAAWTFRAPESNPWRATGQVVTTAVAGGIAFLYFAVTLFAAFIPYVTILSSMK
jgi:hypothetical protein